MEKLEAIRGKVYDIKGHKAGELMVPREWEGRTVRVYPDIAIRTRFSPVFEGIVRPYMARRSILRVPSAWKGWHVIAILMREPVNRKGEIPRIDQR